MFFFRSPHKTTQLVHTSQVSSFGFGGIGLDKIAEHVSLKACFKQIYDDIKCAIFKVLILLFEFFDADAVSNSLCNCYTLKQNTKTPPGGHS